MAATRPRPDEPSSALTWVAIVITLGIALALVAIFGGPKDACRVHGETSAGLTCTGQQPH